MMVKVYSMASHEQITSKDNQHLKFARRVRDRKEREHIFIEGKRLCHEALTSGIPVEQIFLSEGLTDSEFAAFVFDRSIRSFVVSEKLLGSIADTESPQGIVMIARRPETKTIDELFAEWGRSGLPLWVCLEGINNPSNLGAVIRTAEAAGVRGAVSTAGSADPFAPRSIRASMGSAFRLPFVIGADPITIFTAARDNEIRIAAMDASGDSSYLEFDWTRPTLLVIGGEAPGLSADAAEAADDLIRIDMQKTVESLNLAVSAGIVFYEAVRQNRSADR